MRINPEWLENKRSKKTAECCVCLNVLVEPTSGCPDGHPACHACYLGVLGTTKKCPMCRHPTNENNLVRNRPLEDLIEEMQTRCKNGPDGAGGGRGEGGAAPAKRAKGSDAGKPAAPSCIWRGRVNDLAGHLKSCEYEPVKCANAAAGCLELVVRKDAARHASETCTFRKVPCMHCRNPFKARVLQLHEGGCPEAKIECPNAGCGATFARRSMGEHRGVCGREEVECPCPGCEERMVRAQVGQHVETSRAAHEQRTWKRAAEMDQKVAGQGGEIARQKTLIAAQANSLKEQEDVIVAQQAEIAETKAESTAKAKMQAEEIKKQLNVNAGLQKRAEALTHVFTWSTDGSWSAKNSLPYTFTDGVRGKCFNVTTPAEAKKHLTCFALHEGPECTFHFKCSILDKDDKVLRVISPPERCDFQTPPTATAVIGMGTGAWFDLTEADKAGAVREDGSIKIRMVVHLYLPE